MKSYELGPLEMEALGLFEKTAPLGVSEVQTALKTSGHDLAYTTVMTVLVRLHKKGFLNRKKGGRQFLYTRAKAASRVGQSVLTKLRSSLFRHERLKPVLAFLQGEDDLTETELLELKKAVEARLKRSGQKQ